MNLEHTDEIVDTEWRIASIETPAITTHAIFRPSSPPIAFGVNGDFDKQLATQLIQSIEQSDIPEGSCAANPLATKFKEFDTLVAIHGVDRRFVKGWWIDEPDLIHLVPVYSSEIGPDDRFHYDRMRHYMNIFDLNRDPEPFFQFKMQGVASQLSVNAWGYSSYRELISYKTILQNEPGSSLVIKNRNGEILTMPGDANGWTDSDARILSHLESGG